MESDGPLDPRASLDPPRSERSAPLAGPAPAALDPRPSLTLLGVLHVAFLGRHGGVHLGHDPLLSALHVRGRSCSSTTSAQVQWSGHMADTRPPFCRECGTLLVLPRAGADVICTVCGFRQPCAGALVAEMSGARDGARLHRGVEHAGSDAD